MTTAAKRASKKLHREQAGRHTFSDHYLLYARGETRCTRCHPLPKSGPEPWRQSDVTMEELLHRGRQLQATVPRSAGRQAMAAGLARISSRSGKRGATRRRVRT